MTATAMAMNLCAMIAHDEKSKPTLRRGDGGMSEERLDWHLSNWVEWHRDNTSDPLEVGVPAKAGSGMGKSGAADFESMVRSADVRCAEAVEATVNDLPIIERCAVHHRHLAAVFRSRGVDPVHHPELAHRLSEAPYQRARLAIARGLSRRGIL